MNEKQLLNRAKKCLEYFDIDYSKDTVYLTDRGNSVICNPETEWKEFIGWSLNSIAEFVAKELNKKVMWFSYD